MGEKPLLIFMFRSGFDFNEKFICSYCPDVV